MPTIRQAIHLTKPKRWLTVATLILLLGCSSCGYVLHPKRVGQTGGNIDPAILVLDAAGLLFGILPGVVAFAVDISTGAIYLAPGERSVIDKHKSRYDLTLTSPSFSSTLMQENAISRSEELLLGINRDDIARKLSLHFSTPVHGHDLSFHTPVGNTVGRTLDIYATQLSTTINKG